MFIKLKGLNIKGYHEVQIMKDTLKILSLKSVSDKDNTCSATFQPRLGPNHPRKWEIENNLKPRM